MSKKIKIKTHRLNSEEEKGTKYGRPEMFFLKTTCLRTSHSRGMRHRTVQK
jgi:hypothetical protein